MDAELDMRVNKGFDITWGEEEDQKSAAVNVYLQVQNLLNTASMIMCISLQEMQVTMDIY